MIEFLLGVVTGSSIMYIWFNLTGLIKTREQWYYGKWINGKKVPKCWDLFFRADAKEKR